MKKFFAACLSLILMLFTFGCGGTGGNNSSSVKDSSGDNTARVDDERGLDAFEYSLLNLCGTDALGRRIETAYSRNDDIYVGIFYSVWLGQHRESQSDVYDIEALLSTQEGRDALYDMDGNPKSQMDQFHFSSKPLYGYYNMLDPWVVARHVELLTACGLDYLCIDATNAKVYIEATELLLNTLLNFKNQGFNVPKVMFYTNSDSGTTVTKIYNQFYQTEKYDEIWWAPNGKPMIIGITENNNNASDQTKYSHFTDFVTPACKEFFDVVDSQWPQGDINDQYAFPWMSWQYPQHIHSGLKTVSVSVAQHSPLTVYMSDKHVYSSRGYDHKTNILHKNWEAGQNFQSQWETVFENREKLQNVLVTGWNEWMAIKKNNNGMPGFVDVYNEEYSRDCEMSAGKYGDNFYMQLMQNVRKFKYTPQEQSFNYPQMTVDIDSENLLVQWDFVTAQYKDFSGEVMARNFAAAAGSGVYTDNSNRNDVTDIKVVHNADYLYFYVKTKGAVTAYNGTDKNWMNVLISTGKTEGFAGYDYIINRSPNANGKTTVEKSAGGYNWQSSGEADYRVYGNVILYRIPLTALGLTAENCKVEFKVCDNVTHPEDIMDYYVSGESAPIGRLSYSYGK